MFKLISGLFGGSKSEKDVKEIRPLVQKINEHFASYQALSNDALRSKTSEFKSRIKVSLAEIDNNINALTEQADQLPVEDILGKDDLYKEVDALKKHATKRLRMP